MSTHLVPQSTFVRRYLVVMSVLTIAAILAFIALMSAKSAPLKSGSSSSSALGVPGGLPVLGTIEGFSLTDQRGENINTDMLRGTPYVADFIFTSCAGVCPVMTGAMAELYREFGGASRVAFVSISVDPKTDTPEVLAAYAERYDANPEEWHFLTGPIEDIQTLAHDQFMLGSGDEPINHSDRFVLVDQTGRIRGYYTGSDPESMGQLREDIALVNGL